MCKKDCFGGQKEDLRWIFATNILDRKANERGLYRFDEQGHDNLLQLFDYGDKGLKTQLAHIANELDDVDFVVKDILEGERSMMNTVAIGDTLQLCFNLDKLKIFDKISGKAVI